MARFRQAGDGWGQAAALPMRARLRRYDDLDGPGGSARGPLAGEFGRLSLGDQLYNGLRWIDVYARRGDTARQLAKLDAPRSRARQTSSAQMPILIDATEAGYRVLLGDLDRAADLFDDAEPQCWPPTHGPHSASHGVTCPAWTTHCRRRTQPPAIQELPILSLVTVNVAALAGARRVSPRRTPRAGSWTPKRPSP